MERSAKKAINCSLYFPMKVKLKREVLLGEELRGLGEDIGILIVIRIINSDYNWNSSLKILFFSDDLLI